MIVGSLSGTLSAQMVWWSVPFLPILDAVPSHAPACLAPRLSHRHHVRGRTLAAPSRASWPPTAYLGSLYSDCTRRRAGGQRPACTYGVEGSLVPMWGNELEGCAGILLACHGAGDCWIPERGSHGAHTVGTAHVRTRSSNGRSGKRKSLPSVLGYLAPPHAPLIPALIAPAPSAPGPSGAHSSPSGHPPAPARSPRVLPSAFAPGSMQVLPACSPAPSHPHPAHALPACSCTT